MALRVLLADESATIKKVIQLALQDFGVEVKSVPVGSDVLVVARSFQPDVIFADVLLTKRNGYEVSADIKGDAELEHIPVVLMWSGFMELDQNKVISSRVDRSLEKPFDPEQLRSLVKELVPRLQSNSISGYLQFPNRPEFVENQPTGAGTTGQTPTPQSHDEQDIFSSPGDEAEDFKHVPLPRRRDNPASRELSPNREYDEWSQADLAKFRVGPAGSTDEIPLPEIDQDVDDSPIVWSSTGEEVSIHNFDRAGTNATRSRIAVDADAGAPHLQAPSLDFERAEQILREQSRDVLETIAWRILPDIVERIVREELQKLLKDSERLDEI